MKSIVKETMIFCTGLCLVYLFLFAVEAQDAPRAAISLIAALILGGYVLADGIRKTKW
jgi:hypothetical protein